MVYSQRATVKDYTTIVKDAEYDKYYKDPKDVLILTKETIKNKYFLTKIDGKLFGFKDEFEYELYSEGVSNIEFIPPDLMGRRVQVFETTKDKIRLKSKHYRFEYAYIGLWVVERLLKPEKDPEYFI